MGPSWGPLGASWAHFGSHFLPPLGGPGEAPGGHFWTFLGRPSRDLKNELLFVVFFTYLGSFFLCYYLPSVVFLAPWLAASCICKNLKIHWFLWVASHMRLVLATPEAINFQGGRVINIGGKRSSKKRTHGTRKHDQQIGIFEAKMAPKMDPGGFQKRVHKTVGN